MPLTQVIAVIARAWLTCSRPEVVEVARSACCLIFMVSRSRVRSSNMSSPGGLVAVFEFGVRSRVIGIVACGKDDTFDVVEQLGCSLISGARAICYVSCPDEDGLRRSLWRFDEVLTITFELGRC